MNITIEDLEYELSLIDGVIRIIISKGGEELGSLYFERAKKVFQRKPIGMDAWGLVEAKIEKLYDYGDGITPKGVVSHCQGLIKEYNLSGK